MIYAILFLMILGGFQDNTAPFASGTLPPRIADACGVFRSSAMGCIYQAKNRINGKCYVGKTVRTIGERRRDHEYQSESASFYFHNALRKYGFDAFEWKILFDDIDEGELDSMEVATIKLKRTKAPNGYNLTDGGGGVSGRRLSAETKEKISKANKGKRRTIEFRIKMSEGCEGRRLSAETKEKISKAGKGKRLTEEHKEKLRVVLALGRQGRICSAETRVRISKARKGKSHQEKPELK